MSSEVSERYAGALFSLAEDDGMVAERKEVVTDLIRILDETPELNTFFNAVKISREEKKAFIDQIFGEVYDKDMINFLKVLIDKGRIQQLKEILKEFIVKANEALGIKEAVVWSARKLSEEDLAKLKGALEKKYDCQVILSNKIDKSVIAGIKVVVGNSVTDVTVKDRLEKMKGMLLKGGLA